MKSNLQIKRYSKFILIFLFIGILICVSISIIKNLHPASETDNSNVEIDNAVVDEEYIAIVGNWEYQDGTCYKFNDDFTGEMLVGNDKYSFTFKCNNDKIIIDYTDSKVRDAEYQYSFVDNKLQLIGGEGTAGGEYLLVKK